MPTVSGVIGTEDEDDFCHWQPTANAKDPTQTAVTM